MSVIALLLCAGRGSRLGADLPKALVPLAGRPLFAWSLEAMHRAERVNGIVMVGPVRLLRELAAACGAPTSRVVGWTEGGEERQHSVGRGLHVLPPDCTHVAVHDAARALVSPETIDRAIATALEHGAAVTAAPLPDTLKRATLGLITETVPRAGLWVAQTPQVIRRDWLERAHRDAGELATDDAALVEALGHPVHVSQGDPLNFKITTAADLALAEAWLASAARDAGRAVGGA